MWTRGQFVKDAKIIFVSAPKDYNSAAATAEWINMSKYDRVVFIIQTGAWAAGTAAVTLNEGTADATGSQALAFTKMYTNDGAATTDTLTETTVTSNTFNLDTANSLYVIEVTASMLTRASNFDWVNLAIASPGANADLYSVIALGFGGRDTIGLSSPSAIT